MRALIAGNWKMNTLRRDAEALALALVDLCRNEGDPGADLLVCPPAIMLQAVGAITQGTPVALGAQDCHTAESGAHTGDISAAMLADSGCSHVIVGHSERRANHEESNAIVKNKAAAAQGKGLTAIICVGETLDQRDGGETLAVITDQIAGSLPQQVTAANSVIAYEPVWAIGTGRTPTIQQIAEVHDHIRSLLTKHTTDSAAVRLLYGGSVNPGNAEEILAIENVNGGLVGGASLKAEDFWAICSSSAR
jgi:triosephosphate isomerase